jgi:hypothetical protein
MFAWRTVWTIKPGRMDEAKALMAGLLDSFEPDPAYEHSSSRMYFSRSGTSDALIYEEVWPTIEGREHWRAGWVNTPEAVAFRSAWNQLGEVATPTEVSEVREWKW